MRIGIVGCGFVADLYAATLRLHSQLELAGVADRDRDRADGFAAHHGTHAYPSLDALLDDASVSIMVNLTNPRSHEEGTRACLEAGKHVYSEKPLAMSFDQAQALVELAEQRQLVLAGAPSTLLGQTAQTMWRALRQEQVGRVRLVYAEMEEGMVHLMPYRKWFSGSGKAWPYQDEFEIGCTIEHAGYCLTWLAAFFGPARSVTAFSNVLVDDKGTEAPLQASAPDFSVACIVFDGGMVARMTCGIVAPHDHRLRIIGDRGVLSCPDSWSVRSPVFLRRWLTIRRRMLLSPWRKRLRLVGASGRKPVSGGAQRIDFALGVAEMAEAIEQQRTPRLSARFCLHVTELALAITNAATDSRTYHVRSSFDPIEPMPWACT